MNCFWENHFRAAPIPCLCVCKQGKGVAWLGSVLTVFVQPWPEAGANGKEEVCGWEKGNLSSSLVPLTTLPHPYFYISPLSLVASTHFGSSENCGKWLRQERLYRSCPEQRYWTWDMRKAFTLTPYPLKRLFIMKPWGTTLTLLEAWSKVTSRNILLEPMSQDMVHVRDQNSLLMTTSPFSS